MELDDNGGIEIPVEISEEIDARDNSIKKAIIMIV